MTIQDAGIKTGNQIVPLDKMWNRTNIVNNTVLGVTGNNGFSPVLVTGFAEADPNGKWRFVCNIFGTKTNNTSGLTLTFPGITFDSIGNQKVDAYGEPQFGNAYCNAGTSNIIISTYVTTSLSVIVSINVSLDSKPAWADANMSASGANGFVKEGTGDVLGVVKKNSTTENLLLSQISSTNGNITDLEFTGLVVGKRYKVSGCFQFIRQTTLVNDKELKVNIFNGSSLTDANTVLSMRYRQTNVGDVVHYYPFSVEFTAISSTLRTATVTVSNMRLEGNVSANKDACSFVQLTKLENQ